MLVTLIHFEHHSNHLTSYLPNYIQNALINIIYGKITRLSTDSFTKSSVGRLTNLCTNGIGIFEQLGMFVVNIGVGSIGVIADEALLWQYVGVCSLVHRST